MIFIQKSALRIQTKSRSELRDCRSAARPEAGFKEFLTQKYTLLSIVSGLTKVK